MTAKCRICGQELRDPSPDAHHLERAPIDKELCVGCWAFSVEMQTFLIRARDRTVMGNWTEGWLQQIIKNPERYRGLKGDKKSETK